ncbi:class I SAM-dependent methyltransferase [Thermoproteota archaeon]
MSSNDFDGIGGEDYNLNRIAYPYYDEFQNYMGWLVHDHIHKLLDKVKPRGIPIPKILELGTGTGDTTKGIIKYNDSCYITGMDCESVMLNQARKRFKKYLDREYGYASLSLNLIHESAEDYLAKLDDKSIDAVVAGQMLHNNPIEKRTLILEQSCRVLKKSGIFVLGDKIAPDDYEQHAEEVTKSIIGYANLLKHGREDLFEYWIKHTIRDDQPDLRMTVNSTMEALEKAGMQRPELKYHCWVSRIIVAYND